MPRAEAPAQMGSGATLARALTLHNQGCVLEAVSVCREVLAREPLNSDALYLMDLAMATLWDAGTAAHRVGGPAATFQRGSTGQPRHSSWGSMW